MYVWYIVPLLVAELILGLLWTNSIPPRLAEPVANSTLGFPSVGPTSLAQTWPYASGPPYTLVWLFNGSIVTTGDGSLDALVLTTYEAKSFDASYRWKIPLQGFVKIAPVGQGYMYFQGSSFLTVEYSLTSTHGPIRQKIPMQENRTIVVPLDRLIGLIEVSCNATQNSGSKNSRVFEGRMWSEEFANPGLQNYIAQCYLEQRDAWSISFSELNNMLMVQNDTTLDTYFVVVTPDQTRLGSADYLAYINNALAATLGPNVLSVSFSGEQVLGILEWTNATADNYTISIPTLDDVSRNATAATFGLYEFDPNASPPVCNVTGFDTLTVPASSFAFSPSRIIVQWPVAFEKAQFSDAGAPDTDGVVWFFDGSTTTVFTSEPYESVAFYAVNNAIVPNVNGIYTFQGPLNGSGPYTSVFNLSTYSETSQAVYVENIYLSGQPILDFFTEYGATVVDIVASQGGGPMTGPLNALFTFNATTQTWSLPSPATMLNEMVTSTSLYDDIPYILNISVNATQVPLLELYAVLKIQTETKRAVRYTPTSSTILDLFNYPPAQVFSMYAFGAGGGSIRTGPTTANFGGAGAASSSVLQVTTAITYVEVQVGRKGRATGPYAASGGTNTYVILNDTVVVNLGSGGGATSKSSGGNAGNAAFTFTTAGDTSDHVLDGFSASSTPWAPNPNNPQVTGVLSKPTINGQVETYQGSGSGYDGILMEILNGSDGYFTQGGGRFGGLGGLGAGNIFSYYVKTREGGHGISNSVLHEASTELFGAGGGGASFLCQCKSYGTFDVTQHVLQNYVDSLTGGPISNLYTLAVKQQSQMNSVLSFLVQSVWTRDQQQSFVGSLIQDTLKTIASDATVEAYEKNYSVFHPDWYVLSSETQDTAPVYASVPFGPFDRLTIFPTSDGSNVRIVQDNEDALLDSGRTLCIINDGQISESQIPFAIDTILQGPFVPENTVVTSIRLGRSQPKGSFNCFYLGLSDVVADAEGPLTWFYKENLPGFTNWPNFVNGVPFVGTINDYDATSPWTTTKTFFEVSESLATQFQDIIYETMSHSLFSNINDTTPNLLSYFPQEYTLPNEGLIEGPGEYIRQVWPCSTDVVNATGGPLDLVDIRTFVRPNYYTTRQNFTQIVKKQEFQYTGAETSYQIPTNALTTTIYAFGAGATAVNGSPFLGASGSFAQGTFKGLAGHILTIGVAQGATGLSAGFAPAPISGGKSNGILVGGGASYVIDTTDNNTYIVVAAGGGSAGINANGLAENTTASPSTGNEFDGRIGRSTGLVGASTSNADSGAGGSGKNGGTAGQFGFAGAAGKSRIPRTGVVSTNVKSAPFWTQGIALGGPYGSPAGHGKVVIVHTY